MIAMHSLHMLRRCDQELNGNREWDKPLSTLCCTANISQDSPSSGLARFYLFSACSLSKGGEDVWAMETLLMKLRKGFDEKWVGTSHLSEGNVVSKACK